MTSSMGSWGVKIAKDDKTIDSSNVNDYKYWSKYNGLTLIDTVDITFNAEGASFGIESYAHGLDYTPFVLVKYTDTTFLNSLLPNDEVLPTTFSDGLSEGGTITAYDQTFMTNFTPIFGSLSLIYTVDDTNIDITWEVGAFQGGGGNSGYFTDWTVGDIEFTVTAMIYMFDMTREIG